VRTFRLQTAGELDQGTKTIAFSKDAKKQSTDFTDLHRVFLLYFLLRTSHALNDPYLKILTSLTIFVYFSNSYQEIAFEKSTLATT